MAKLKINMAGDVFDVTKYELVTELLMQRDFLQRDTLTLLTMHPQRGTTLQFLRHQTHTVMPVRQLVQQRHTQSIQRILTGMLTRNKTIKRVHFGVNPFLMN